MLLSNGHSMAVPPDFFVHPQTGRVLPIAGNVAYDPASSTLVYTTDTCTGNIEGVCEFFFFTSVKNESQLVQNELDLLNDIGF